MALGDVVTWAARLVWLAMAPVGGAAFGDALADRSRAVQLTGTVLLWVLWTTVAVAFLVPSTVSLTVVRTIAPGALLVALIAAFYADETIEGVVCVTFGLASVALVASGEFGEAFAQASAYGSERRFVLRPPVSFMLPAVVSWLVLCACVIIGPLALAAGAPAIGFTLTAVAIGLAVFLGPRFHRLSRRWLVVVPAGLVLHDHVVLAETAMFRRSTVASIGLALADTEAADLTGPAPGHAIEIGLREQATVVLAPTRDKPGGTALHASSVLIAPSRPGRALAAVAAQGLAVG